METYMATRTPMPWLLWQKELCVFLRRPCRQLPCWALCGDPKNFTTFHQKQGIFGQTNMMLYALLKQMFLGGASRHVRGTERQIFGMVQGDGPGWSWLLDGARVSIGGKKNIEAFLLSSWWTGKGYHPLCIYIYIFCHILRNCHLQSTLRMSDSSFTMYVLWTATRWNHSIVSNLWLHRWSLFWHLNVCVHGACCYRQEYLQVVARLATQTYFVASSCHHRP